jgi:glycosyltransferase involved in cell wall biosynthesis
MKILLVIPCYKCEAQIVRVIKSLASMPHLLDLIEKVLILDNQSPDQTAQKAFTEITNLGLNHKITVAINIENYGLGGSHKVGFNYGIVNHFDYLAIIHGDDQAEVSDLNLLIDVAKEKPNLSAILGARFMRGSKLEGYSLTRMWGNLFFNLLYSVVTLKNVRDLGSGINLFKIPDHDWEVIKHFSHHFSFNYDLILYYALKKKKKIYVPITWKETDQVSNVRNIFIGLKALKILFNYFVFRKLTVENPKKSYLFIEIQ